LSCFVGVVQSYSRAIGILSILTNSLLISVASD